MVESTKTLLLYGWFVFAADITRALIGQLQGIILPKFPRTDYWPAKQRKKALKKQQPRTLGLNWKISNLCFAVLTMIGLRFSRRISIHKKLAMFVIHSNSYPEWCISKTFG